MWWNHFECENRAFSKFISFLSKSFPFVEQFWAPPSLGTVLMAFVDQKQKKQFSKTILNCLTCFVFCFVCSLVNSLPLVGVRLCVCYRLTPSFAPFVCVQGFCFLSRETILKPILRVSDRVDLNAIYSQVFRAVLLFLLFMRLVFANAKHHLVQLGQEEMKEWKNAEPEKHGCN